VDTGGCSPGLSRQVQWLERRLAGVEDLARLTPSPWAVTLLLSLLRACGVPFKEVLRSSFASSPR
jgi:hypothetical protein